MDFNIYITWTQDKVKVIILNKFSKIFNTQHTFWSWLIRCVNMKWIWLVLREIQSGHDSIHRRTDGWTDRQTDKVKPVYPPFNFIELRGIIKLKNIYIFGLLGEQPARASFLSPISGHVRTISANERRRLLFSHWLRSFSGALRQWIENGTWSHAWETREKHSSSWEWLPCCVWIKMPGSAFIKRDQLDPWIKDQLRNALLSTILSLQLPNFVSCGRACPSHMTQNLVTVGVKLLIGEWFLFDPWSMDQADLVW